MLPLARLSIVCLVLALFHMDVGTPEPQHFLDGRAAVFAAGAVEDVHALFLCQRSSAEHALGERLVRERGSCVFSQVFRSQPFESADVGGDCLRGSTIGQISLLLFCESFIRPCPIRLLQQSEHSVAGSLISSIWSWFKICRGSPWQLR